MSGTKSKNKKAITAVLLTVIILLAALTGVFVFNKLNPEVYENDVSSENSISSKISAGSEKNEGSEFVRLAESLNLNTELTEISVKGNILKIDAVNPGLDTSSQKIYLYDMAEKKILSETDLEEDLWITEQTESGFYAVSVNKKTLYIYNNDGSLKTKKKFEGTETWSPVAILNDKAQLFVYAAQSNGKIYLYDLTTAKTTQLESSNFYATDGCCYNGEIYLYGTNNEFAQIDTESLTLKILSKGGKFDRKAPKYSINTTDLNFALFDNFENKTVYLPFNKAEEAVVGKNDYSFATSVTKDGVSVLRVYNLKNSKLAEASVNGNVSSVCYMENGNLLILTGNAMEKQYKIYQYSPEYEAAFAVSVTDKN